MYRYPGKNLVSDKKKYRVSHLLVDLGRVDFAIWVFHPLAQLPSHFCQIPSSQAESGIQWNTQNSDQPNQVNEQMGHPVHSIINEAR